MLHIFDWTPESYLIKWSSAPSPGSKKSNRATDKDAWRKAHSKNKDIKNGTKKMRPAILF